MSTANNNILLRVGFCVVVLALLGTRHLRAQGEHRIATGDSLELRQYFPLEVGYEWEYEYYFNYGPDSNRPDQYLNYQIVGDSVVNGIDYLIVNSSTYDRRIEKIGEERALVRHDSSGAVVLLSGQNEKPWFISPLPENPHPRVLYAREEVAVSNDTTVDIGGLHYDVNRVRTTLFGGSYSNFDARVHASEIGLLKLSSCGLTCIWPFLVRLVFADVGGSMYGTSAVATSGEKIGDRGSLAQRLSIYPVPARGKVTVELSVSNSRPSVVSVYDILGRQLRSSSSSYGVVGTPRHEIDVSDLAPGIYFVHVEIAGSVSETKSFVVQR